MPVQCLIPITPWFTSIPNPSRTLQPALRASRTRLVSGGLGITSATTISGLNVAVSKSSLAFTSGNNPMEVALITTWVWVGTLKVVFQGMKSTYAFTFSFKSVASSSPLWLPRLTI